MSEQTNKNKQIAKNTMYLYLRMFFVLGVSLYTTRVVFNVLGVVDYGIYNVVNGFVLLFSFLNTYAFPLSPHIGIFAIGAAQIMPSRSPISETTLLKLQQLFINITVLLNIPIL